jgi:hypothetical protein
LLLSVFHAKASNRLRIGARGEAVGFDAADDLCDRADSSHRRSRVATMQFEVFAEIGLELKQRSPLKPLMNISIANGAHSYLPTPAQCKLGGYETWIVMNKVQLDVSVKMVATLIDMFNELR